MAKLFFIITLFCFVWLAGGVSVARADCGWFINNSCGDVKNSQANCAAAASDSYCSETKPNNYASAKCCCCAATPLGCCEKINKNSNEKTAVQSTVAQCFANGHWANVKWDETAEARNNSCVERRGCCKITYVRMGNLGRDVVHAYTRVKSECTGPAKQGTFDIKYEFFGNKISNKTASDTYGTDCIDPPPPPPPPPSNNVATAIATAKPFEYDDPTNPLRTVSVPVVTGRIISALLAIIGSIFLLIVIYGGFVWMTAAGNDAKVAKARNTLAWGVFGLVVITAAWILTGFIFDLFSKV